MNKMSRKPQIFISTSAIGIYDDKGQYSESDCNFANDYLANIVKDLINNLPEKQKIIIHLRDVEGLEFKEIAEITEKWQKTKTVLGGSAPWANPETSVGLFDLMVVGEEIIPILLRKL